MKEVRLNSNEIDEGLSTLDNWTLDSHKVCIRKVWEFDNFKTAMHFLLSVGEIANRHDHHPEFLAAYTKVRIRLFTHDAHGLTQKDFELALEIDRLATNDFSGLLNSK